mmetsp:Transcript_495/g.1508  ORF Transcript_495/g.1508 Transcript_495/m.1508 type:complete len:264 (-) Transcript_495:867-1658(-)
MARLPTTRRRPSTTATMPRPARVDVEVTDGGGDAATAALVSAGCSTWSTKETTAVASGCDDVASAAPRRRSVRRRLPDGTSTTLSPRSTRGGPNEACARACLRRVERSRGGMINELTAGLPSVKVPVLSNATTVTLRAPSSAAPPLRSRPCSAPTPVATMTAVGVARPSAHGQAMTSTLMANSRAKRKGDSAGGTHEGGTSCDEVSVTHTMKSMRAMATTVGTKSAEMRSAKACMGALDDWAVATSDAICASAVSPPTLVARR